MSTQELKQAGLKVTLPRMKILDILHEKADAHMSADDVYRVLLESDEDIGLATVYRVLTQFEAAGLIQRHNFSGGQAVFELNQGEHHDHILCVSCGIIEEFYDESIERLQLKIAEKSGFELVDHSLVLYGKCKDCNKRTSKTFRGS